jgi:hypothetical protein
MIRKKHTYKRLVAMIKKRKRLGKSVLHGILIEITTTCRRRCLIEDDSTISDCLSEAATFQMPSALRRLFARILVFCEVTNVRELWDKHLEAMGDDFRRENENAKVTE